MTSSIPIIRVALNVSDPKQAFNATPIRQELLKQEMEVDRRHDEQLLALQQARLEPGELKGKRRTAGFLHRQHGNRHPEV